jgi:deoxyribodipyrimidine photolyase
MNEELDPEPKLDPPRHITNRQHYVGVTTIALKGIIATDLPGRFPTTSGQGNAYVMVMYDFDSNTINTVGIKSRKKESLTKGYNEMYKDLRKAGINPVLHRLDNEKSNDLIKKMRKKDWTTKLHHRETTDSIMLKEPYKHSRTILLQYYMEQTVVSLQSNGID